MSKIPTAEEFFEKYSDNTSLSEGHYDYLVEKDSFKEAMIEFAKLHVEAAKKEYLQQGFGRYMEHPFDKYPTRVPTDEDSILNAYPLENVK